MAEHIYLSGSEDVRIAGNRINEAASTISSAMSGLDETFNRHRQQMEQMLARFEAAVDRFVAAQQKEIGHG